ncbi:uncharacterized protein DUF4229 [Stackebrandtia endophytica]|uniref:Uncharacterized protein DUF4229 n=1 Tax=Stackebrandtia endophytica TaxID=1496996 RepID=A0A543AZG6_9ACTN|nr:DUF4229 domain-containing protein [Stackebrandtia endophytica]TQL77968.1 uncharacterized protein DUF4229 [Stackebrandtia endophytica]
MSPTVKYLLGRVGLFVVLLALLWPTGLNPLVIAMIAMLGSFVLSLVVLRKWRDEMVSNVDATVQRRREQKEKLRRELAGDEVD